MVPGQIIVAMDVTSGLVLHLFPFSYDVEAMRACLHHSLLHAWHVPLGQFPALRTYHRDCDIRRNSRTLRIGTSTRLFADGLHVRLCCCEWAVGKQGSCSVSRRIVVSNGHQEAGIWLSSSNDPAHLSQQAVDLHVLRHALASHAIPRVLTAVRVHLVGRTLRNLRVFLEDDDLQHTHADWTWSSQCLKLVYTGLCNAPCN